MASWPVKTLPSASLRTFSRFILRPVETAVDDTGEDAAADEVGRWERGGHTHERGEDLCADRGIGDEDVVENEGIGVELEALDTHVGAIGEDVVFVGADQLVRARGGLPKITDGRGPRPRRWVGAILDRYRDRGDPPAGDQASGQGRR